MIKIKPVDKFNKIFEKILRKLEDISSDVDSLIMYYENRSSKLNENELKNIDNFKKRLSKLHDEIKYRPLKIENL